MLNSAHARLLVRLGRRIEIGVFPNFPVQLRNIFSGSFPSAAMVTDITNSLSNDDVVFFFKALVILEKNEWRGANSASPTIWAFQNIQDRMPERGDELLDWALKNRGENIYTPAGHTILAQSLEEYGFELIAVNARRDRRHLEWEAEKAEAIKRKRQKKIAHQKRLKARVPRAKKVKSTLEELTALTASGRLRTLSANDFPLEAVPMDLIDKEALEELSDEELQKLFSRIDRRKGKWGSVAKSINSILDQR